MDGGQSEIRWGQRLPKAKLRRLYESDALGALDEDLLEDVGLTLLLRCESILEINEAVHGKVRCPRCRRQGRESLIERSYRKGDPRDEVLTCTICDWCITWGQYRRTFQGKQLNMGRAGPSFRAYIASYRAARTPKAKLLAIDRLIHEWHYSLRGRPDLPTRPVLPNLIAGQRGELLHFLDELTYGAAGEDELRQTREAWHKALGAFRSWCEAGYPAAEESSER